MDEQVSYTMVYVPLDIVLTHRSNPGVSVLNTVKGPIEADGDTRTESKTRMRVVVEV